MKIMVTGDQGYIGTVMVPMFNSKSINEIPNGIISLKGGDLKDELKHFKEKKIFEISIKMILRM